jgi:peptidoglycan/LPS O-acetylase OafA/YrhL
MATTRERQEELIRAERELPPPATGEGPAVTVPRRPLQERMLEPISGRWAAIGAVAWVVLVGIGIAVEPPPTNPDAVDPWFLDAIAAILLGALVATFTGFWLRRRWSLAASLLASGLLVVSTLACPASGHHAFGAWWIVQLACASALVATSALGLRRG